MTNAQAAQQNNRDSAGKYAAKEHGEAAVDISARQAAPAPVAAPFAAQAITSAVTEAAETGRPARVAHPTGGRYWEASDSSLPLNATVGPELCVSGTWALPPGHESGYRFVSIADVYAVEVWKAERGRFGGMVAQSYVEPHMSETFADSPDAVFNKIAYSTRTWHDDANDLGTPHAKVEEEDQAAQIGIYAFSDRDSALGELREEVRDADPFEDHDVDDEDSWTP